MQYPIKWCELHTALFLAGTNLQLKLDPTKRTGLSMVYDRKEKELLVTYNGQTAIVPISNVASMVPGELKQEEEKVVPPIGDFEASQEHIARGVQVETPMSHVHAGPGRGKTRS